MFATRSEYDRGVNTFSPEGRLFQVEYAMGAVKLGSTAVAIRTDTGIVLASERRVTSALMEPRSIEKIFLIDDHVGCASSGLTADARTLIDHARVETQNHRFTYDEPMPVESVVECISDLALDFSESKEGQRKKTMSRPFGVALLVAGVDKNNSPQLWCTDPSASNTYYYAAAIGSAQEGAEAILLEQYHKAMTFEEAEELSLIVLRQVMEEKLNSTNIEIASIRSSDKKFRMYSADEVSAAVGKLPASTLPTAATLDDTTAGGTATGATATTGGTATGGAGAGATTGGTATGGGGATAAP